MIEQLKELMAKRGWTQTHVSRAIGKSPAVISQYLKGSYPGDVASLDADILSLINQEAEKDRNQKLVIPFVRTLTAGKCLEVIGMARDYEEITVISAEAGMGKTMAMRQYAAENRSAILLEADPGYTARVVLEELCAKLDIKGISRRGDMHEMSDAIVTRLRDSGRVLLIDEAENLPTRALEVIRRIHDKASIGVALAGTERLITNLKGTRGSLAQLYSRVGFALDLGGVLPRSDVDAIATSALRDAQDPAVGEALFTASQGNARRLSKLLRGVHRHSQKTGVPVDAGVVAAFLSRLIK